MFVRAAFVFALNFLVVLQLFAIDFGREEIAMRSIGHELMLRIGDSTTVLQPVKRSSNQFRIDFTTEFAFEPVMISSVIDSVFKTAEVSTKYQVAVVPCAGSELVYGYEIGLEDSLVPCTGRQYPKSCYSILITLLDIKNQHQNQLASLPDHPWLISLILLASALAGYLLLKSKPSDSAKDSNNQLVQIGQFTFDRKNLSLILGEETTELTGKECDLLALLINNLNETVERDLILNQVWGDEGDYIGRTLDVFISKLRKKLEGDSNVRIISVRGVGYKLILNG